MHNLYVTCDLHTLYAILNLIILRAGLCMENLYRSSSYLSSVILLTSGKGVCVKKKEIKTNGPLATVTALFFSKGLLLSIYRSSSYLSSVIEIGKYPPEQYIIIIWPVGFSPHTHRYIGHRAIYTA